MSDPFEDMKTGGWSMLDNPAALMDNLSPEQKAQVEAQQLAVYDLNRTISLVFSTPEGSRVLEWMRELATEGSRFDIHNETDPALAAAKGFFREGQAAFYFDICHRLQAAEQGPPVVQQSAPAGATQE